MIANFGLGSGLGLRILGHFKAIESKANARYLAIALILCFEGLHQSPLYTYIYKRITVSGVGRQSCARCSPIPTPSAARSISSSCRGSSCWLLPPPGEKILVEMPKKPGL